MGGWSALQERLDHTEALFAAKKLEEFKFEL
jgi:hypothetical protein